MPRKKQKKTSKVKKIRNIHPIQFIQNLIESIKAFNFHEYMSRFYEVDYYLIISVVVLLIFGLTILSSASFATDGIRGTIKQAICAGIGLVAMTIVSFVDYHTYKGKFAVIFYLFSLLSLFAVFFFGTDSHGAARWIYIGPISIQPSEFLKPAIIILMAYALSKVSELLIWKRWCFILIVVTGLASGLIWKLTNNLSTAVIVFLIAAVMFCVAYPNKKIWIWIFVGVGIACVGGVFLYFYSIQPIYAKVLADSDYTASFRITRILSWLYPEYFLDSSRQTRYSMYAMGFGGLFGRGLYKGTMKYYISEPANDFIFATLVEELGIVGACFLIYMFIYQIRRILIISNKSQDSFGGYLALGVAVHIAVQVILNIGVGMNVLPNTGISLPYISSGGTALILQLAEVGMVLNVSRQIPKRKKRGQGAGERGSKTGRVSSREQRAA